MTVDQASPHISSATAPDPAAALLRDVELTVRIELGRTRMLLDDVLKLRQGAIVELNKLAGDPVDVFVNDRLVARGEAVVVNDKFGIRITDIVSPAERIARLR